MSVPVVAALTGASWEADLLAGLARPGSGVTVVRRCVDVTDLLATAATGQARAALVAADLRRFDPGTLDRLHAAGMAVVVVCGAGGTDAQLWRQSGADDAVTVAEPPAAPGSGAFEPHQLAGAVAGALVAAAAVRAGERSVAATGWADPAHALPPAAGPSGAGAAGEPDADPPEGDTAAPGRLVAVWGPAGAPGRTTVAVNLAAEAAAVGVRTLLADADVYGGVVAQVLGLLDESAGLAAAVRLAAAGPPGPAGRFDVPALARLAPLVSPELRVLTGIPRADRWPELRPASLEVVWATARQLADLVVVDCGFNLERDEELTFDTPAPRRNGATLVTLEHADVVVAVARADPVGLARFARALPAVREAAPAATLQVVVTQVRRSVLGPDPHGQVLAALERYAGVREAVLLPDDRPALDRALARGQTLAEAAPGSPLRRGLAGLAAGIADGLGPLGAAAPGKAPRASRWRSSRRTARGGAPGRGTGVPEPQSLV